MKHTSAELTSPVDVQSHRNVVFLKSSPDLEHIHFLSKSDFRWVDTQRLKI